MYCVAVWLVVFSEVCVAKMIIFQWCNKYIQTQFERLMQLAGCLRKKWPVACIIITRWFLTRENSKYSLMKPLCHSRWYFSLMRVGDNHYVVESTNKLSVYVSWASVIGGSIVDWWSVPQWMWRLRLVSGVSRKEACLHYWNRRWCDVNPVGGVVVFSVIRLLLARY